MIKKFLPLLFCVTFACQFTNGQNAMRKDLDIQGHRGWKGAYPENTLRGFCEAVDLGVNTIELDVVISKDSQVIVSHEPWFNSVFTTLPDGTHLAKDDEKKHNIFMLSYEDIKKYDVGTRTHPDYPQQKSVKAYKPALRDVLDSLESRRGNADFGYNIEIKRKKKFDHKFHPDHQSFVHLVMEVIESYGIKERITIQSFDHETLTYLHYTYPEYKTSILSDDRNSIDWHIRKLGYTPDVFSPNHKRVDKDLISRCHDLHMKIIPWTVNQMDVAGNLIELGVDGIITDYPDKLFNWLTHGTSTLNPDHVPKK
jgi:glycerophosphoryl diester phosphodiesterase